MIRQFIPYYKPHQRLFWVDFLSAIFVALLELAFPLAVQWFIDKLLPTGQWGTIMKVGVLLLLIYILSSAMHFVVNYLGHKLGVKIEADMREELFTHIQKQPVEFFDNTKTGHLMSRITNDLMDIGEFAHHGPEDFFIAIMTFLGAFVIMFNVNAQLALTVLVILPFLAAIMIYSNRKMKGAWKDTYSKLADINGRVEDSMSGIRVVKSFTNEEHEVAQFNAHNERFKETKFKAYKVMGVTLSSVYILTRLLTLIVLVGGAWLSVNGKMSYGELVSFVLYMNVLIKPIDKITALLEMYPKGMTGFKNFKELLNTKPTIEDAPDAIDVSELHGDISLNNVTFAYDQQPTLTNISMSIRAGESVALVGPSGAGKTTITSLIPRFYDVDGGSITIDGIDIRSMTQSSLRKQIGVVQQDVFLFAGTVRENIEYGKLGASFEDIQQAAKRANLHDFIESLPNGYNTEIGERGLKLSGGQKQRLSIARMFLKNPPILILDEATSALDTENERIIQAALEELAQNRTTIIIAHRLATVRNTDRVYVVTKNGIEEQGTYDELVEKGGIFANLHKVQVI
ncbi:ABC transporter ATP-binding protein [Caryophanon latum]|uniref:Multidrug ABC transporter ATP-binding protein n=1 Tax=Caryophanon latum TaxID=33977 RepID=A0A1C0Z2S2_9BACL|nr:ABC transporter ATP-binding protein [Caryophanon latum]OCS93754.1 multidrug ABC transporter ATP-binding protein [Caryophanon latum]